MNTRWDERNCHPQSVADNIFKKGNYPAYTRYLLDSYGADWLKRLIDDGNKIKKWTDQELQEKITYYQNLIKSL